MPDHTYAVVGYNPSSSMPFEVFNPWGADPWGGPRAMKGRSLACSTPTAAALVQNCDFQTFRTAGSAAGLDDHGNTMAPVIVAPEVALPMPLVLTQVPHKARAASTMTSCRCPATTRFRPLVGRLIGCATRTTEDAPALPLLSATGRPRLPMRRGVITGFIIHRQSTKNRGSYVNLHTKWRYFFHAIWRSAPGQAAPPAASPCQCAVR